MGVGDEHAVCSTDLRVLVPNPCDPVRQLSSRCRFRGSGRMQLFGAAEGLAL